MKRRQFLKASSLAAGAGLLPMLRHLPASAAGREGILVVVTGNTMNSMDIHRTGTNRPSYAIAVNLYDRLVGYGTKTLEDGSMMYDYATLEPELAESWKVADDGLSATFFLRKDATFWDGAPVTAQDGNGPSTAPSRLAVSRPCR